MYERNAIVIERYFSEMFGYNDKNNLKKNYENYCDLVEKLEKYQETSEIENSIMSEYEKIAEEIKATQKLQEMLYKKNIKFQENRKNLFEILDEDADTLNKKFEKIKTELNKNQEDIENNIQKFVSEIAEFNEKSLKRTECGRERRIIENEYQKELATTTDNFQAIKPEKVADAKSILKEDNNNNIKTEISEKIIKNGEKEKVPFNQDIILKAVEVETDTEEKILEILCTIYDKTSKLLLEIKNDSTRLEKHKKSVKDSESKLRFLNAIKDYIILFLDNERLNVVGGEKEHKKLMEQASVNADKDIIEIKKLYDLLIKEITGKASKKAYRELYNIAYLRKLEDEEKEFEKSVSKLNMIGTVIYPDYWRLEGMRKIFDTFETIITEVYNKDLTEFGASTGSDEDDKKDHNNEVEEISAQNPLKSEEKQEIQEDEDLSEELDFNIHTEDESEDIDEDEYEDEEFDEEDDENEDDDQIEDDEDDEFEDIDFGDLDEEDEEELEDETDEDIDDLLGFYDEQDEENTEDEEDLDLDSDDDETEEDDDFDLDDLDFDDFDEEDDGYDDINFEEEDNDEDKTEDEKVEEDIEDSDKEKINGETQKETTKENNKKSKKGFFKRK